MNRKDSVMKFFNEQKDYMDERVKTGIELYRKARCRIKIVDKDGQPIKGVTVKAKQKSHDFNFGCNMFLLDEFENEEKNQKYKELFPTVFNYAVAPFYWDALEPEKGKQRYSADSPKIYRRPAPDLVVDYCKQNDIRIKGHCLVYDLFTPDWMKEMSPDEIKKEIERHMEEIALRYKDQITDWDILNEMICHDCYKQRDMGRISKFYSEDDYMDFTFRTALKHPFQKKFINENLGTCWQYFFYNRSHYYLLLKDLLSKNNQYFDGIGMQFHELVPKDDEEWFTKTYFQPHKLYDILDTYGELGKPIQISEISLAAWDRTPLDLEIQADILENLYKIWFSHKSVDGIVYWNLVDGYMFCSTQEPGVLDMTTGENQYASGLLNPDLSPKPAFERLKKLINEEWHTEELVTTHSETGICSFKGFKGMYDLEFEYNGKKYVKEFHLESSNDKNIIYDLHI